MRLGAIKLMWICLFIYFQYGLKYYSMDQIELDHVSQVIGYHPSYLEHFLKIQTFIMQGDGPLPYDYRHYLAIMVSNIFIYLLLSENIDCVPRVEWD